MSDVSILPPKPNLRPVEIAEFLDISLSTVYEMIGAGEIPALRIGRHIRIPREQFLSWYRRSTSAENLPSA